MTIMDEKLTALLGHDIIVVQVDGRVFKGRLAEFDEEAIILEDVVETSTTDLKWRVPIAAVPQAQRGETAGEGEPNVVRLTKVIIRMATILRIWTETEKYQKRQKYIIWQKSVEED